METIDIEPCWLVIRKHCEKWVVTCTTHSSLKYASKTAADIYRDDETRIIRVDSATFTEEQDAQATPDV